MTVELATNLQLTCNNLQQRQAKKEEKCKGCIWSYNGFCICSGLKPCTKSKK